MPLRTDGSPAMGDPLCVGTSVQLRVGGAEGRCLQVSLGGGKVGVAAAGAPGTLFSLDCAGSVPASSPAWADPTCTSVNRLAAHAPLRSHRSEAAARMRSDERLCLSGVWRSEPRPEPEPEPKPKPEPGPEPEPDPDPNPSPNWRRRPHCPSLSASSRWASWATSNP